jgi:hypothetical protein
VKHTKKGIEKNTSKTKEPKIPNKTNAHNRAETTSNNAGCGFV